MKLAIKRLRHSDATFFAPYFQRAAGTKQKAITLEARIFADMYYPGLSHGNPDRPEEMLVALTITGPDGAPPVTWTRKVLL
jgi:hypothetical protein